MKRIITAPSSLTLLICVVFSVFFTAFCGPIGYHGDSWNSIYASLYTEDFFHPQPEFLEAHYLHHRPGLYVIGVYLFQKWLHLWRYPRAAHFVTLLLASLVIFFFGRLLEKLYPDEPLFVVVTLLLIFFYGPVFASTFNLSHNMFFFTGISFWGACLCFLKLAQTRSFLRGFFYGFCSLVCYVFSVFIMELFVLIVLVFPFLVYFGTQWSYQVTIADKVKYVILRAVLPAAGMFATVLVIKYFIVQYIGRSTNFSILHSVNWIWKYLLAVLMCEVDTVVQVLSSHYRYSALLILGLLLFLMTQHKQQHERPANQYTPFLLGGLIFLLGIAPLIVGGYTMDPFSPDYSSGRFMSSSFGVVLILSGLLLLKRNTIFHKITQILIFFLLSCNIAFTFILADAWQEATRLQKSLFTSLLEICPDVENGTDFVFLDAQAFLGSSTSIHGLPQIIYNNQMLRGALAYSGEVTRDERTTIITSDMISPRVHGSKFFPLEKVIILKNTNYRFEIVDLRKTDSLNAIWAESYFELNKDALHSLEKEGIPEKIVEDLKPLKHQAFFKENFLEEIKKHIGKENTEKYQSLILKYSWNWTKESFKLTDQDIQSLRKEGIPEGTVTWLDRVKNRAFPTENAFLEAAKDYIGKEARNRYRDLFVKYAREQVKSIYEVKSNPHLIKQKRVENAFTEYLASLPD